MRNKNKTVFLDENYGLEYIIDYESGEGGTWLAQPWT
jgi:hypothetical protein